MGRKKIFPESKIAGQTACYFKDTEVIALVDSAYRNGAKILVPAKNSDEYSNKHVPEEVDFNDLTFKDTKTQNKIKNRIIRRLNRPTSPKKKEKNIPVRNFVSIRHMA